MPSRAEMDRLKRAQEQLVSRARRELAGFVALLPSDPSRAAAEIEEFFPQLVRAYGDAGATVAAEWFEETARGSARVALADLVGQSQAEATARWASRSLWREDGGRAKALALLTGAAQRYVRRPGRETIRRSAWASGARFARVTDGDACAFCVMLSSRGAVYESRESAAGADDYHDDCGCEAISVWSDDDLPEGYDPESMYGLYLSARGATGKTSPSTKDILAAMREMHGMR